MGGSNLFLDRKKPVVTASNRGRTWLRARELERLPANWRDSLAPLSN